MPKYFHNIIVEAGSTKPKSAEIIVETREGNSIKNKIIIDPYDEFEIRKAINKLKADHPGIIERPDTISLIYNCHGMTFASRRTGIDDMAEIGKILREDNYKSIRPEEILPGDIVIYFQDGEACHSGIILKSPSVNELLASTIVLSKWGDACEFIHTLLNCDYLSDYKFYRCFN